MTSVSSKIIPILVSWGVFIYVILQVPYPETLTQASLLQILVFFIPLFLAFIFTFNSFLKNIFSSCSISLGIIFILTLKSLDSLNIVTSALTIIATSLLVSYFRKIKKRSLTNYSKIPKLTRLRRK